jgi:hypothetical protein
MSGQLDCPLSFYPFIIGQFVSYLVDQTGKTMTKDDQYLSEEFVKLALAIEEHLPGYLDAYFGPDEWMQKAKQAGKLPLDELAERTDRLAGEVSRVDDWDAQRKDYLAAQLRAMQMSLRLLAGEKVSLVEEVRALYDVQPAWKDESIFVEPYQRLEVLLPGEGSLKERLERWNTALRIPPEKIKELLQIAGDRLREWTSQKFILPEGESFRLEFVSDKPWRAYNWYQGEYQSRIDINTDLPIQINEVPIFMAHEGYPGHHTERCVKDAKLIRQRNYLEQVAVLINAPSCVISEAIATTALDTVLTQAELTEWYRDELLPLAGLAHIDVEAMMEITRVTREIDSLAGNAAFMLHDQNKSPQEIRSYMQEYGLNTEEDAEHLIKFISDPLGRSYIFTYFVGKDLLDELFASKDRDTYFRRLLEEPVTPGQVRDWIRS